MHISVVIPVFGCQGCLLELKHRLDDAIEPITHEYEIIFVDDRSPDDSWSTIKSLATDDPKTKGIQLSKNYGQHFAITTGLDHAKGEWVIVMDCDLQDNPEDIPKLYNKCQEGFDIVVGQRTNRKDSLFKKITSRLFHATLTYLTDTKHDTSIANFGIYSKKVIQSINIFRENNRNFPLFIKLVGFKRTEIPVTHSERITGKSAYNITKLMDLALDTILAHSNKPLRISIKFGFLIAIISSIYAITLITRYLIYGSTVEGWTSVMVSMFIMFGLTLTLIGIIGLYIGKIFDEVKCRPLYIMDDSININVNNNPNGQ